LVTGAEGFIGRNTVIRLNELGFRTLSFTRKTPISYLPDLIEKSGFIIHLAGENRPADEKSFNEINAGLTSRVCDLVANSGRNIPLILASSSQARLNNPYGKSKLEAENLVRRLKARSKSPVFIFRLPGVFGKWCKPNYNSVVATFCYNISRDLPININNPLTELSLVYVDDVVKEFVDIVQGYRSCKEFCSIQPEYQINLNDLALKIKSFKDSRNSLMIDRVGSGFTRKLYSTYVSYLPTMDFAYSLPSYSDNRGIFAEILKTKDSGQFSFFTAKAGVTRGGHYHHSKTEKFLVVKGEARFNFKHIVSEKKYEIHTSGDKLKVVETVPGWSHSITNTGNEEMVVLLWANEIFNPDEPDTTSYDI